MSTNFFKPDFLRASSSRERFVPQGRRISYSLAEKCIFNFISVMGDHGFKIDPGLLSVERTIEVLTRRLTVYEEFNEPEITEFLREAREAFAVTHPGRPVLTRFSMGIYLDNVLRDPSLGLTPEQIAERQDRLTIFVIPYVDPNVLEIEELVSARIGAAVPLAATAAAPVMEAVAPQDLKFFGPGDIVYDFGGLQP